MFCTGKAMMAKRANCEPCEVLGENKVAVRDIVFSLCFTILHYFLITADSTFRMKDSYFDIIFKITKTAISESKE